MTIARPEPDLSDDIRSIQRILDNLPVYAALQSLCEVGLFDSLNDSAATVDDLVGSAASTMFAANVSRDYLERILRVSCAHGWTLMGTDGRYHLTDVGESLVSGTGHSNRSTVMQAAPWSRHLDRDLRLQRRARARVGSLQTVLHRLDLYEALHRLCELRIPDRLEEGPTTVDDLHTWSVRAVAEHGGRLHLSVKTLGQLLTIGKSQEWLAVTPAGFYRTTRLGQLLTSGPISMRPAVMTLALRPWWGPLATMADTLRMGRPAALRGVESADSLLANESAHAVQQVAAFKAHRSATLAATIAGAVKEQLADQISHVVPIGGDAILLDEILRRLPYVGGVLAPPSQQDAAAIRHLHDSSGLQGRWAVSTGNDTIIPAVPGLQLRPLYLLWEVINTLPLGEAQRLLARIAAAMDRAGSHSVLWLVQSVVPETVEPHPALAQDLLQMTRTKHGRERTLKEYTQLLRNAGLRLTYVRNAGSQMIISACRRLPPGRREKAPGTSDASARLVSRPA